MKIFIDGYISMQFSGKKVPQFEKLITLFHKLKIISVEFEEKYHWNKFLITPHIFTEICQHFCQDDDRCKKRNDFKEMANAIIPILKEVKEVSNIDKNNILEHANIKNPIIEIGDISIFLTIEDYGKNDKKIAVLTKDGKFLEDYGDKKNQDVLVIDFDLAMLDMGQL